MIVNLGLIKSEKEIELIKKTNDISFDVNPCKIDAWASGRAKIITSTRPKEQIASPLVKPDKNSESSKGKKKDKEKDKEKIENTMYRTRKMLDPKKIVKEQPPKELPRDFIRPIEEKKETKTFDYDEMKLK
jgi:replication fork clamp-binding protein CrfC